MVLNKTTLFWLNCTHSMQNIDCFLFRTRYSMVTSSRLVDTTTACINFQASCRFFKSIFVRGSDFPHVLSNVNFALLTKDVTHSAHQNAQNVIKSNEVALPFGRKRKARSALIDSRAYQTSFNFCSIAKFKLWRLGFSSVFRVSSNGHYFW